MIKINLLPFRAARKKENIRKQLSVFLLSLVFIIMILYYYNNTLSNKVVDLQSQVEQTKKEISNYKNQAEKVDKIKKELDLIKQKTEIIRNLESNRKAPVLILDLMTQLIIKERMWFTSFEIKNDNSNFFITGVAVDNKTIADFMTRLEKSTFFTNVSLGALRQEKVGELNFKRFDISCSKLKPAEKIDDSKGKK
ncbi:MAG: PilN domain-containing protein [Desulfobacterales bacterium]|nr:PilN domain-containing protein [Desulfobacterales bacterium]